MLAPAPSPLPLPNLYDRVRGHVFPAEWLAFAPDVEAILRLKRERNAVLLAHNYQTPEIFHTVADIVGDSLALAREAAKTDADVIVLAGVHFMAETAKLLIPDKAVLIPDTRAGCSLADSITPADIRLLRARYPGVPVVTYVNTSAAVKAESDICCTSGNAAKVITSLGVPRVIMLPDEYLARNVAAQVPDVEVIAWTGHCEVHERFTPEDIRELREAIPAWWCSLIRNARPRWWLRLTLRAPRLRWLDYVGERAAPPVSCFVTECSMSDNVALQYPDIEFVRPCNLCPHMKRITLSEYPSLSWAAWSTKSPSTRPWRGQARRAVERMLQVR